MTSLRTNFDAYRVLAEALVQVRRVVRTVLRTEHGEDWENTALGEPLRTFLQQRREREASIQWRLQDSADLLEFTSFANLAELIQSQPALRRAFASVSPDEELLHARFQELDSIHSRVAFARPVGDVELEFVVSLAERLRRVEPGVGQPGNRQTMQATAPALPPKSNGDASQPTATPAPPPATADDGEGAPHVEPQRPAAAPPSDHAPLGAVTLRELEAALRDADTPRILAALYHEVTQLAEALWANGSAPPASVWERVRESRWYGASFSRLGLKPVSDFFDLHATASRRINQGASRTEIQGLLHERRFGEVLIALRELFRTHLVEGAAKPE